MAFVVGVVIVYQVLSTDVNAHLKEYATFKAMGYHNSYLLGVVFEEAIILAFVGFIPGFLLPNILYALAANATALPLYMTGSRAMLVSNADSCNVYAIRYDRYPQTPICRSCRHVLS